MARESRDMGHLSPLSFCISGARGGEGAGTFAFVSGCPQAKLLMVMRCPLVTIPMPKCDLLNAIFARQHRYLRFCCISKY